MSKSTIALGRIARVLGVAGIASGAVLGIYCAYRQFGPPVQTSCPDNWPWVRAVFLAVAGAACYGVGAAWLTWAHRGPKILEIVLVTTIGISATAGSGWAFWYEHGTGTGGLPDRCHRTIL